MSEVPVKNNGKTNMYVGGICVPAGETRMFEESLVPPALRPPPVEKAPEVAQDPILALLDGSIPEITDSLPGLCDEDVEKLRVAEEAGKTRKGVIAAIEEEKLRRASMAQEADRVEGVMIELRALDDDALMEKSAEYKDDEAVTAAIDAELAERISTQGSGDVD